MAINGPDDWVDDDGVNWGWDSDIYPDGPDDGHPGGDE